MKNILLILLLTSFSCLVKAQLLDVPKLSPLGKVEQIVGLTTIEVEYSRPSARGRVIFGGLVPYGRLWRTGANLNTTITLSHDIKMNQQEIKKGAYAIFTIPAENADWEVLIYDDPNGHTPIVLDESKVVSRFNVAANKSQDFLESFTIDFGNFKTSSANMYIKWANLVLDIPLEVSGEKMALDNIENLMAGPKAQDLFLAAEFHFNNDLDLDLALKWTKQSGKKFTWDAYWPHYLEARILAKKNRFDEAIVAGTRAEQYVRKAGYIYTADQIEQQLTEWKDKIK